MNIEISIFYFSLYAGMGAVIGAGAALCVCGWLGQLQRWLVRKIADCFT